MIDEESLNFANGFLIRRHAALRTHNARSSTERHGEEGDRVEEVVAVGCLEDDPLLVRCPALLEKDCQNETVVVVPLDDGMR